MGKIPKPYVSVSNDIELCVGKPATLNVSQNPNTTYRWKKDGAFIANATQRSFETLQEGKYQVEAKEGTCTAVSDTVVLKKPDNIFGDYYTPRFYLESKTPNQENVFSNNYFLCDNQEYSLLLFSYYDNPIKYQLFKDSKLISETDNKNNLMGSPLRGEGIYFVKSSYGTCTHFSNNLTVRYKSIIKVDTSGYNSKIPTTRNFCSGREEILYFGYNSSYGGQPQEGNIYKNETILKKWNTENNRFTDLITVKESGNYYAIGKIILADKSICTIVSDTFRITIASKIQDLPQYNFDTKLQAVPITTCKDTASIVANNYIGTFNREIAYKWTKDGVVLKQDSSSTLQTTQVGTYQLETTYKGGCTVISSPYKIEFGKINIGFRDVSASICPDNSYYLFTNHSVFDHDVTNNYELYKDGQIFLKNVDNPALRNQLVGLITQAGTYKLKVTNGKCEGTSPDFILKVDKIPTTITPTDSVTFCTGKTVELKASTEAGLSYIWERNGSVINQANQATLTASADGLYKATLLRGACWGTTPTVKLKSLANILPTATLTGDQKIDYDKETKLSVNLSSYAPWTFKLSDGKSYTATKSPFEIAVKPLTTTTYSLSEVSNICGTGTVSGTAKIEVIILSAEEEKDLSVEVFPVPSSEICNWKIETPQATTASVELLDGLGMSQFSEVSSSRSQSHSGSINLSNLKAGTYFLKLHAGEKSVTRKVVKF